MEKYCRAGHVTDDDIIRCMPIVGWITKVADTNFGVSTQQCLCERTSILRYTNSAWLI